MKRVLVMVMALMLICSASIFAAEGYFNVKLGVDFAGNYDVEVESYSDDADLDTGITLVGEYFTPYSEVVDLGFGLAYQMERGYDDEGWSEDAEFSFIPLYGAVKYKLESTYLLGHLGYNFFSPNDDYKGDLDTFGGFYYGLGAGMNLTDNVFAEVLYSVNNGGLKHDDIDFDIDVETSQISLMVGMSF